MYVEIEWRIEELYVIFKNYKSDFWLCLQGKLLREWLEYKSEDGGTKSSATFFV